MEQPAPAPGPANHPSSHPCHHSSGLDGRPERTSGVIARLGREAADQDIEFGQVMEALKERGFGGMLMLLAIPNAVAPGAALVVGAPIILIACQLALGYDAPWLPQFISRRKLPRASFRAVAARAGPFLARLEQWLRPRAAWLTSRIARRLLGLYIVVLALLLAAPIPLGSTLPAFAISLIAAGLAEDDGAAVALGLGVGLAGAAYAGAFMGAVIVTAVALFS